MDVNKQTKRFSSLEELEAFLAKFPEMKTGFLNVNFEKNGDPDPVATDAMHEEIETINEEVAAVMKRHPNIKMYHLDFQYGDKNTDEFNEEKDVKTEHGKMYERCLLNELDEAYNFKEFHEHFWKEVRKHGGLPNVLKTVEFIASEIANDEINIFKRELAAMLYKIVFQLRKEEK